MMGCSDELGLGECCLDEACPTGDNACIDAAIAGSCAAPVQAFRDCQAAVTGCSITAACFPPASGFLPDFSRRFGELDSSVSREAILRHFKGL